MIGTLFYRASHSDLPSTSRHVHQDRKRDRNHNPYAAHDQRNHRCGFRIAFSLLHRGYSYDDNPNGEYCVQQANNHPDSPRPLFLQNVAAVHAGHGGIGNLAIAGRTRHQIHHLSPAQKMRLTIAKNGGADKRKAGAA